MAQNSWPSPAYNDRIVTDVEYEKIAARFSDDGVYGDPTDTAVVTAGPGLTVNIRAGVYASVRGHAWTSGTTPITLPVAPNTGGTRRDRVVLRLDRATWTVRAVVVQGSTLPPALTQQTGDTGIYEVSLATLVVLTNAATVSVTRAELYVGGRYRPCTSTTRDPNPRIGDGCVETDTGSVRVWNGASWAVVYSSSGDIVVDQTLSAWTWSTSSVLEIRSGIACLRLGSFQRSGGTLAADIQSRLPVQIPSAYQHRTRDQFVMCYVTGFYVGRLIVSSAASDTPGQVLLVNKPRISTGEFVLPQSGTSWAVRDAA
ncbi:hypothetical protein [Streptomyces sp. CRN 30]|uniref:hypothetical protein n=1 Tax=Streptomyces sp. CRN 30 TaxID=3075613 RepID=UPI002A80603E|nr:hypothetical protein [Streptomyces sp. CRN 30]